MDIEVVHFHFHLRFLNAGIWANLKLQAMFGPIFSCSAMFIDLQYANNLYYVFSKVDKKPAFGIILFIILFNLKPAMQPPNYSKHIPGNAVADKC